MAVLITGASAGFGEAMCRTFVGAGYRVIGAARRADRLQALADELGALFYPLEMDVSCRESVENVLNGIPDEFSDIDCLITSTMPGWLWVWTRRTRRILKIGKQ